MSKQRTPTPLSVKSPLSEGCAVTIVGGSFRKQTGTVIKREGTGFIVQLTTGARLTMQGSSLRRLQDREGAA